MPELSLKQWLIAYAVITGLIILSALQFAYAHGRLDVSVLDVGQGDSILIKTPQHHNILIDAGPDSSASERLGKELGYFDDVIDLFVMTHPHDDHFGGILDVMHRYKIKKILITGAHSGDPVYREVIDELKKTAEVIFAENNKDIQIGSDLFLDILYPLAGQSFIGEQVSNPNNTSIAMRLVRISENRQEDLMILTGDAEQEEEREILLSGQNVNADILKVGHHGSRTATSDIFLGAIKPKTAVISVGEGNSFNHPHKETTDKLTGLEVRQTMKEGTVHFNF